jgi:hypothetical protein
MSLHAAYEINKAGTPYWNGLKQGLLHLPFNIGLEY